MSDAAKRTKTLYCGAPGEDKLAVVVDVEAHWEDLISRPPESRLGVVAGPMHWMIHLDGINLPDAIKDRFWSHYTAPGKDSARDVAIYGLTAANSASERRILDGAETFKSLLEEGHYAKRPEQMNDDMLLFALGFADIVRKRDTAALRRMVKIIDGNEDNQRGGYGSELGEMFREFVNLHVETRSLPTKKALRHACGLGDRESEKIAAKMMKTLGLWGLPTEREVHSAPPEK